MTPEEARKKFLEMRDQMTETTETVPRGGAGEAFVGDTHPPPVVTKEPPNLAESPGQDLPGMALAVGAGLAGEKVGEKVGEGIIDRFPAAGKYGKAVKFGARVAYGTVVPWVTDLGYQNLRRAIGDPGAADNFEQSFAISTKTASDQLMGGIWGSGLATATDKAAMKAKVDPERLQMMNEVKESLKRTYERIGGAPLVEDMRGRWNPMRILKPLETELNDNAVVKRLKDSGLDPQMARKVVLQGGMTTADLLDNTPYSILQAVAEGSFSGKKYMQKYQGTRSKLYELWAGDLADEFSAALPEEKLGQSIAGAINGNFNFPNAVMTTAMNNVKSLLRPDFSINMQGVKTYFKQQGISANSPVGAMIYEQPNTSTFDAVSKIRQNLSSIMHAQDTDPRIRAEAERVAKTLDKSMGKQLPAEVRDHYLLGSQADDVLNEGQFRTKFVQKMLGREEGYRQYAKYLLKNGDVGNFSKLEAAVGKGEADKVRRGLSEIVLEKAVLPDGTMNPASIHQALNEHGKYGRYFLESTLGPQWMKNADSMKNSMDMLLETAKGRSLSDMGLGSLKYASVAPVLWDVFHGGIDKETVVQAALLFTGPKYIARILTSPKATANIERLAKMATTGSNPHTFSRLVARTAEAVGMTPEDLLAAGETPGVTRVQKIRRDLGEGRFRPRTGNAMVDAMVNPAQSFADMAAGRSPGDDEEEQPQPGQIPGQ